MAEEDRKAMVSPRAQEAKIRRSDFLMARLGVGRGTRRERSEIADGVSGLGERARLAGAC